MGTTQILEDEPIGPMIRLRHPEYAGLQYGDGDGRIIFGPRAMQPPNEAWVPENHPLLASMLEEHPEIEIVQPQGPSVVYVCPVHPDREFKTQSGLKQHFGGKGHSAQDILAVMGGEPVSVPAGPLVAQDGTTSQPPPVVTKQGRL